MKSRLLAALLAFSAPTFIGCSKQAEHTASSQGSVAVSKDDALVFAADSDTDSLIVLDAKTETVVATVKTGASPEQVLVGADDTIYVTNRMGRSITVIRRGQWQEAARLDVGVEPVSMAMTGDGKTLYVVSATSRESAEFGILTSIDTNTLSTNWELPIGHEPRGLALLNGNRAMISLYKDGDVTMVDLVKVAVLKDRTDLASQLNREPVKNKNNGGNNVGFFPAQASSRVRAAQALAASPDGLRVYAAANLSSDGLLVVSDDEVSQGFDGGFAGGGSSGGYGGDTCGATAISAPALLSFDTEATPLVDSLKDCASSLADNPPTVMTSGNATISLQGPKAVVVDSTGSFIFVVNHDSNNVAVVASKRTPQQNNFNGLTGVSGVQSVVSVGAGPTGIALTKSGETAWVYNSLDHSFSRIESVNGILRETKSIPVGQDTLSPDAVAGRKLFFSTTDSRMTTLGLSCGTCHMEGREDGHVWNFTSGPRQTPTLSGRMLEKTQPLHWDGEFKDMGDLGHAITGRMGGNGITAKMTLQISAYLATLPAADAPFRGAMTKTPAQQRGAQVFTKAQCNTCHSSDTLTDNKFADVGTLVPADSLKRLANGFNTPSLLGISRTAPYLHDGSVLTLKERLLKGKETDKHGLTSKLSDEEVNDLVAYLGTL